MNRVVRLILRPVSVVFLLILAAAFLSPTTNAFAKEFVTECLGPKQSEKMPWIYLHGIFKGNEKSPPIEFRDSLKTIAEELALRIAIPRNNILCKNSKDKYCWGNDQPATIQTVYKKILQSVHGCIDTQKPFGILGFSNGGYHASRVVLRCLAPQPKIVLAVGSSAEAKLAVSNDLSHCSKLSLLIGKRDLTHDKAKSFVDQARLKKLQVEFATFNGGHTLPILEVRSFLKQTSGQLID